MNLINVADLVDPKDKQGRTYREINSAAKHRFETGQLVEIDHGVRLFVAKKTRDCDGTPLYSLTPEQDRETTILNKIQWCHGFSENEMKLIS